MTITELANAEKQTAKELYINLICGKVDNIYTLQLVRKLKHTLEKIEHKLSLEQLGFVEQRETDDLKGLAERENL